MNRESANTVDARKAALRREVLRRRRQQVEQDSLSNDIMRRLLSTDEFQAANTVMFYVAARSEVPTQRAIQTAIDSSKTVVTPQCVDDELAPWRIDTLDDLALGAFGIPEIAPHLQHELGRKFDPTAIDLVVVPGVAFDRRGHRLGSGRGFYDRFIPRLRSDATLVGLAFDCQIVDEVPIAAHDVPLHIVITPTEIIRRYADFRTM